MVYAGNYIARQRAGKSSLIRCIAGIERARAGRIAFAELLRDDRVRQAYLGL